MGGGGRRRDPESETSSTPVATPALALGSYFTGNSVRSVRPPAYSSGPLDVGTCHQTDRGAAWHRVVGPAGGRRLGPQEVGGVRSFDIDQRAALDD